MDTAEQVLLSAVTVDTTSSAFNVEEFKNVGLQFTSTGISVGNGVFTVQGTIDGTNFVALNTLIDNVTNTNGQNLTRVASKTLNTNTSVLVNLDVSGLKAIRVAIDVTTDGTYSAHAIAS